MPLGSEVSILAILCTNNIGATYREYLYHCIQKANSTGFPSKPRKHD